MGRSLAFRTSVVLGILGFLPSLANAQETIPHQTWQSSPPNGTSIDVGYYVSTGGPAPSASMLADISAAAAAWSSAGAFVNLVVVPEGTANAIQISPQSIGAAFTGAAPLLATSPGAGTFDDGHSWVQITDVSIFFNINYPWAGTDFYAYMLQQFGFALGLGPAAAGSGSVMQPFASGHPTTLSAADVSALQHLYGHPEPATWMLFGLGLTALAAARRMFPRA